MGSLENSVTRPLFSPSGAWQGNEGYLVLNFTTVDLALGALSQVPKKEILISGNYHNTES